MSIGLPSTASKERRTTPGAASKESCSSVDEELCSVWHVLADEQPHLPLAVHTWALVTHWQTPSLRSETPWRSAFWQSLSLAHSHLRVSALQY